jgi:hypothetical protein
LKTFAGSVPVDIFQPNDVDRLYDSHPDAIPLTASADAFNCEVIIINHHSGANIRVDLEVFIRGEFMSTFASFRLVSDPDPLGNPINHRIRIEVLALELTPGLKALLDAARVSEEELLEALKREADRDVPLPFVGAGNDVEKIEMKYLLLSMEARRPLTKPTT